MVCIWFFVFVAADIINKIILLLDNFSKIKKICLLMLCTIHSSTSVCPSVKLDFGVLKRCSSANGPFCRKQKYLWEYKLRVWCCQTSRHLSQRFGPSAAFLLLTYPVSDGVKNILLISARSVTYRPRAAELIVPSGLTATSSTSSATFNSAPIGNY